MERSYGIGLQFFADFIERNAVYVDKTALVWELAHEGGKHFFLSRPRRFGKSLLISTLQAYFEGRKELFKGLAIDALETEWTEYPVIRLDLSRGKYYELERLDSAVDSLLAEQENKWGIIPEDRFDYATRLNSVIRAAFQCTGRQVVVLIDEYDAPMLDSLGNPALQDAIRERIRGLFSPLKGEADHLRFVFLTGISKFSQLSVFSELNNLNNISFNPKYDAICGISQEELLTQLRPDIEQMQPRLSARYHREISFDEVVAMLKDRYDGYHFSEQMTDIYNPWSLIYAFYEGNIKNYWFSTGTPSSLLGLLKTARPLSVAELEGVEASLEQFDAPTERISDPIPVLYQSGYLTLKAYNPDKETFSLGLPNTEVRVGFADSLYKYYADDTSGSRFQMAHAYRRLRWDHGSLDDFLKATAFWYAGLPYSVTDKNQNEQFYQALFYALMVGVGADVSAEQQTSDGRLDIALKLPDAIYILEFKLGKSAEEAVAQIKAKNYAAAFAADGRPVWAVGLNIAPDRRTLDGTRVERLDQR